MVDFGMEIILLSIGTNLYIGPLRPQQDPSKNTIWEKLSVEHLATLATRYVIVCSKWVMGAVITG